MSPSTAMSKFPVRQLAMWLAILVSPEVNLAQEVDYVPRKTFSDNSKTLIHDLKGQLFEELNLVESQKRAVVHKIYTKRTDFLIKKVSQGLFIEDDSLQRFVDEVFRRLTNNNTIYHKPRKILIMKSPVVNALCYGEGTFVVTVGLLSKIRNESQLAFTLAHELAHYELNHIRNRIIYEVESDLDKRTRQEVGKILNEDANLEDIEALRNLIYGQSKFNRQAELKSDSLGFIFFKNAGYKQSEAISLLSVLDSAHHAKYPLREELYRPFHFSKYPFQSYWLKPRLSVYSKKYHSTFIFSNDSIETHPDIDIRKENLAPMISDVSKTTNYLPPEFIEKVITVAEFESVESAYRMKLYDRCLFLALQLLSVHPHNSYLVSMTGKVLIELYEAREKSTFWFYVPKFTHYYEDAELRTMNDFLNNLTNEEIGEIAYHFLNNQSNFNSEKEEHYVLLSRICGLTYREDVQKKVREAYRKKFEKGMFFR